MVVYFVKFVLVALAINLQSIKCDNSKWCYEKCLSNSVFRDATSSNIDIYLEYKKAVIKVPPPPKIEPNRFIRLPNGEIIPGMLSYDPQSPKFFWKRQLRAIIAKADEVSMREFKVDPVEGNRENCSFNNLKKTRKRINCRPRPFVLDVVSTEGQVFPNKVMTKQCSGYCNDNRICSAVNSTNISASVQVVLEDGRTQCSTILVPQDTKCKCQCATTHKDCISNQKFNKKLCSCECTNTSEKSHCQQKIERFSNQHFWDLKTCSCLCRRRGLCTTGTYWDKTRCRCSKQTDNG